MDPVLRTTTPIKYPGYHGDFHATGFFYRTTNQLYLLTCRHVLYELEEDEFSFRPKKIAIRLRDMTDHKKTQGKTLSLYDEEEEPIWIEPKHHQSDVAALPLDFSLRETGNSAFGTATFGIDYVPSRGISPGQSAIVAGYPIIDSSHYAPILRNALISSPLDVDFDVNPFFLIDAKLHDGTSGSPVLYREKEEERSRPRFQLVGIHSGQYDLNQEGSENLNRVWFLKHLRDRLNEIEPTLSSEW